MSKGTVTCPNCRNKQEMEIPTKTCQAFYKCNGCNKLVYAKKTCCVFCDYGDKPCPVAKKRGH